MMVRRVYGSTRPAENAFLFVGARPTNPVMPLAAKIYVGLRFNALVLLFN